MKKNKTKRNFAKSKTGYDRKRRQPKVNRKHKDRLFRLIFSDSEHQASFNPNMGLRGFLYLADSYRKYIGSCGIDLYGYAPVQLPVSQYIIFYNGTKTEPDKKVLRLSDLFEKAEGITPCVEVTATMLNINCGHNLDLMEKCRILWEYSEFIGRIRKNRKVCASLEEAVNAAVESCIRDDILAKFLKMHRAEVIEVILTEYDEKKHISCEKKISFKKGAYFKLMQQVCKKLAKGKTPEQIAEDLDEDIQTVAKICDAANPFAPDYDYAKVAEVLDCEEEDDDVWI